MGIRVEGVALETLTQNCFENIDANPHTLFCHQRATSTSGVNHMNSKTTA